ncbi:MAG TPA: histidine kinase [Terriglobales bacterium]|nr:histidine kinase [Terriglobales bacterium]
MHPSIILVNLLIRIGVAAAIASVLVRSRRFKELLFSEERTFSEKLQLMVFIAVPFAVGVVIRLAAPNFSPADVSLESVLLIGVIGGRVMGALGGVLVSLPAVAAGAWTLLPFNVVAGLVTGSLRDLAANRDEVWSFSPFVDLSIYRWLKKNVKRPRLDWQTSFFLIILALRLADVQLARLMAAMHGGKPGPLDPITSDHWAVKLACYATSVVCVAVPLKIWNNTRIERKLEQQDRMLLQARMQALQSQINPHFLFNTLNSVSSLVRVDPDTARHVIVKLATILRKLLRSHEAFSTLRDEIDFIDDYLDIEVVRFGRDKLRVVKELEPETMDALVPSMLLQPLVENSIKHGLAPKIEGGSITLRSRLDDGALVIEVEDDGVGLGHPSLSGNGQSHGIGMANVAGRMKVLYGEGARMAVMRGAAGGTLVRIQLPMVEHATGGVAAAVK